MNASADIAAIQISLRNAKMATTFQSNLEYMMSGTFLWGFIIRIDVEAIIMISFPRKFHAQQQQKLEKRKMASFWLENVERKKYYFFFNSRPSAKDMILEQNSW